MENKRIENERKKEYLQSYGAALRAEAVMEEEIQELRRSKMEPAAKLDGMPVGSFTISDLSGYMAKVDELLKEMTEMMEQRIDLRKEIIHKIEEMNDETEKLVLRLRYIHMLKWEDVAEKMCYSWKGIHKVHERALLHFPL